MLILFGAIARAEGKADFAAQYWPLLSKWAEYLRDKGLDPENQLSTDDFAGHLAHNTNLSIKAILALGAYAQLATMLGKKEEGSKYYHVAQEMASSWSRMAADGGHTKLAFDRPGTWSQKYNLVWDRILGLNLFPGSLSKEEIRFYLQHQNAFGLPLDNRKTYSKLDWITWTATLAARQQDFDALTESGIAPALAVEPGGAFGRVQDLQSSNEQIAFAHGYLCEERLRPTRNAKNAPTSRS